MNPDTPKRPLRHPIWWSTGELVGMANMVATGIPDDDSVEEFCRRLLRRAIADGLVLSPVMGESDPSAVISRLAICETAYEDRAAEVDMLRATHREIQNLLAAYSQPNRWARGLK